MLLVSQVSIRQKPNSPRSGREGTPAVPLPSLRRRAGVGGTDVTQRPRDGEEVALGLQPVTSACQSQPLSPLQSFPRHKCAGTQSALQGRSLWLGKKLCNPLSAFTQVRPWFVSCPGTFRDHDRPLGALNIFRKRNSALPTLEPKEPPKEGKIPPLTRPNARRFNLVLFAKFPIKRSNLTRVDKHR